MAYPLDIRGRPLKKPSIYPFLESCAQEILKGILLTPDEIRAYTSFAACSLRGGYSQSDFTAIVCADGALPFFHDIFFNSGEHFGPGFTYQTVSLSSYQGAESTGCVQIAGLKPEELRSRVLVVEDIVDTGQTLSELLNCLRGFDNVNDVRVAALLDKPERRIVPVELHYCGFVIPDGFVVGYGLDCGGLYRGLPLIGVLKPEVYEAR